MNAKPAEINNELDITRTECYKQFVTAMDDDLNTSKALAVLFDLANRANKDEKDAYTLLYKLVRVLGFVFEKQDISSEKLNNAVKAVADVLGEDFTTMDEVIAFRKKARIEKNWNIADKIRVTLDANGILLKDLKEGTVIEPR